MSNRLYRVFEAENRDWNGELKDDDDKLARGGRIMDSMLSEHMCEGWLEGYLGPRVSSGFLGAVPLRVVSACPLLAKWGQKEKGVMQAASFRGAGRCIPQRHPIRGRGAATRQSQPVSASVYNTIAKKQPGWGPCISQQTPRLSSRFDHCIRSKTM